MNHTIAAFDFDGTITTKDTLFDFIIFSKGRFKFILGIFTLLPILIFFKLKLIKNDVAKQRMFKYFFGSMPLTNFNQLGEAYSTRIDQILRKEAIEKIKWHQAQGHEVIIVSASIENWIKPWAEQMSIKTVLSTQAESVNGSLTGRFGSANCYGQEKVNRLKQFVTLTQDTTIYAYGDSSGDKELLSLAQFPFYRKFN